MMRSIFLLLVVARGATTSEASSVEELMALATNPSKDIVSSPLFADRGGDENYAQLEGFIVRTVLLENTMGEKRKMEQFELQMEHLPQTTMDTGFDAVVFF